MTNDKFSDIGANLLVSNSLNHANGDYIEESYKEDIFIYRLV